MGKKSVIERHEHELILVLLTLLVISVVALFMLVKQQNSQLMDSQILLQEIADETFADLE